MGYDVPVDQPNIIVKDTFLHWPGYIPRETADRLFNDLKAQTVELGTVQMSYGKRGPWRNRAKRMVRFGDEGVTYKYGEKEKPVHPWTPALLELREIVRNWAKEYHSGTDLASTPFNCGVVNIYMDQTADLYPHTDITYLPQLGQEPLIPAVTLGETRDFILRPIDAKPKDNRDKVIPISHGDLFVMQGRSQLDWKHGIAPSEVPKGLRLSVTFRQHMY